VRDPDALARQLLELMKVVGRKSSLRDPLAQAVEAMEFTPPQVHALMWLGADGPLTMGEVAQRVGVTEKTITGIIDRLEARGYVQRERDQADRRVVRVRLTEQGASTSRQLDEQIHGRVAAFLSILPPQDAAALLRIMERVAERAGELRPPDAAPE
jgi:DNA-binding MarR family transcriptional regulator